VRRRNPYDFSESTKMQNKVGAGYFDRHIVEGTCQFSGRHGLSSPEHSKVALNTIPFSCRKPLTIE